MGGRYISILVLLILSACGTSEEQLARRADKIHESILTVDTHCDTPMDFRDPEFDMGVRHDEGCVDFPRMKEGGLDAMFFAIFIGQGSRDPETFEQKHLTTLAIFDSIHHNVARYPEMAGVALTPDDAYKLKAQGKSVVFIGIENGYAIGKDLSLVKEYYDLGARYITLCHSANNDLCDSSTDPQGPEHSGLSSFGEEVVREMNRLGMIIDVSHLSDEAFYDVLRASKAPVIASHSSCRALCENPRNLNDDMLQALKKNGGVIQICLLSEYLKQPEPNPEFDALRKSLKQRMKALGPDATEEQKEQIWDEYEALKNKYEKLATVADAVNHIQHVVDIIGIDHVGIGSDFDGGGALDDCRDVSQVKNITTELIMRGYNSGDIAKIWGKNSMRLLREVQNLAE
jgi:membrane dipeptidase